MPLNDDTGDEFASHLQDEHVFDANPPPGIEMLGIRIKTDRGSGSFAEDGRLEVAEDRLMLDGEAPYELSVGAAAAADRPGFEIGAGHAASEGQSEVGDWSPEQGHMVGDWAPEDQALGHPLNTSVMGSYAMYGPTEVGSYAMYGPTEVGSYAMHGPTEIGSGPASMEGQSEIGDWSPEQGHMIGDWSPEQGHMIGDWSPEQGPNSSVLGEVQAPFESFMMGPTGMGAAPPPAAVAKVVETARDNRQPPPVMKAVAADVPVDEGYDESVAEFLVGAAAVTGKNHFPLTAEFMQRCGAGCPPRYVRVDSEETYKAFRTEHSPEMSELSDKVSDLASKVNAHLHDPHAHELSSSEGPGFTDDLTADIEDLTILGKEIDAVEKSKLIELWMPKRYDGLVTAWLEGSNVCASLALPGKDGNVKICTSLEPVVKCVEEMSRHAAQSGVAETVVGVLPAMGCVLGAGTILKEVAAAAPAIVTRPEATQAGPFKPFVVRIEPKVNPALSALAMLAMACRVGNQQACDEWAKLGKLSPAPVRQAMSEALALAKGVA